LRPPVFGFGLVSPFSGFDLAARFRAKHRLKLPDAIQLATVVEVGAYALVTHDRDFRRVKDVRVIE